MSGRAVGFSAVNTRGGWLLQGEAAVLGVNGSLTYMASASGLGIGDGTAPAAASAGRSDPPAVSSRVSS